MFSSCASKCLTCYHCYQKYNCCAGISDDYYKELSRKDADELIENKELTVFLENKLKTVLDKLN